MNQSTPRHAEQWTYTSEAFDWMVFQRECRGLPTSTGKRADRG